jgi:hypothetical protein
MGMQDAFTLIAGVAVSFGGGAAIVIALSGYLADLWAKRALQREGSELHAKLEEFKHELSLAKSSYDHYLDLILEYYRVFYRHYRMCQRAASSDAVRAIPDGPIVFTKDEFFSNLEVFLAEWDAQEGKIRLLLPAKLLELHSEAIDAFNDFKDAVADFRKDDPTRKAKEEAFSKVERVKIQVETALREFLRTENLLK